jgi:YfiR/HmsC-like
MSAVRSRSPGPRCSTLQAHACAAPRLGTRTWIAAALTVCTAFAFWITPPHASAQTAVSENAVKAAYLLNFGKFVRFPENVKRGSFDICILGPDPFGRSLDEITTNEFIDGRPVHVLRLARVDTAHQCSIAYIASADAHFSAESIAALGAADVLTVSDSPDFTQHGGMIEFVPLSNHVRFAVNLDAVHKSHIVLSSELLRVAVSVTGGNGQVGGIGEVRP